MLFSKVLGKMKNVFFIFYLKTKETFNQPNRSFLVKSHHPEMIAIKMSSFFFKNNFRYNSGICLMAQMLKNLPVM